MTTTAPSALSHAPSHLIDGTFVETTGNAIISTNPARPDEILWSGSGDVSLVDKAVAAARKALPEWSTAPMDDRIGLLRRWQEVTKANIDRIAGLITDEMGKTLAESTFEANALAGKVDITLEAYSLNRIAEYTVEVNDTRDGHCKYKPHGVMAVIGPFNFPAHLPNGHFIPALLTGNTVILKPSEKTAAVGQLLGELMQEAGAPDGVFNVIHGAGDVAASLCSHDDINGVLFTGSWPVGRRILEANLDRPGRMIALEMGGNNPAVVMPDANLKQAVIECVRAGFATTGQRCTCTRRVIVHKDIAERFIPAFCKAASTLVVDDGRADGPVFMGPLVTQLAVQDVLDFQENLAKRGGTVLMEATAMDRPGHFISPGIVQVDRFELEHDCEVFGPLVQISVADDLDDAIAQANATRYGLAAAIFTNDDNAYRAFFHGVNAGCINRNTGTAGASSKLPFGGTGHSGNHRPAGAFSSEYCAYPIANMVERGDDAPIPAGMQWDDAWV